MAKNKVSEWDSNPANNTDVGGVNIGEGCPPSNINNAIRMTMSQIKELQDGSSSDPVTINGLLTVADANFTGVVTAPTQPANNNSTKVATTAYVDREVSTLGTMSTQNANAVNITGGTIGGSTKTGKSNSVTMSTIGTNAVGKKTVSGASPSGGSDGDVWYKV
jgi:hypothetical protein